MGNKFGITISAVDKVTATVRKINANMAQLTAPVTKLKSSIGILGRETGVQRFGKQLGKTSRYAKDLESNLSAIASPMGALVGAASIGGVTALATEWAKLGWSVGRTARTIGISTTSLQSLQGAAQAAGLSSESLTSGLSNLSTTLQAATYGRNNAALRVLNHLGIAIHRTANGTVKTTEAFMDLSRVMGKFNPNTQRTIAGALGVTDLLPLLRKGPKAIEAYENKMRSLGVVQSGSALASARKLAQSLTFLRASITGVSNSISTSLAPTITPMISGLTNWIGTNRKLIGSITSMVAGITAAVATVKIAMVGLRVAGAIGFANPIVLGITAIGTAGFEMWKHWHQIASWWHGMWDGMGSDVRRNAGVINRAFGIQSLNPALPAGVGGAALTAPMYEPSRALAPALGTLARYGGMLPPVPAAGGGKVDVTVHFENAPPGTKATVKGSGGTNVDGPRISHARPTMINQ